ncbi:TATA-binding protein-associated factor Mot1p [[Candida] railenensis]|uniref:TATA-binding protein-associated factor mot1 n=1 Tax=[Candida] railenensis TaxID=45579 RepID=A0A9P0VYJ3_9ASCO|nr:TATA-binding protein-associated factor Mot1p [[Candida] railenensis]
MSRLDRLVILLETASTPFIRNTAADQLSDLSKGHPEETINLLGRVYPYLKSPKWETRIAAARALGGIVSHAELWDPNANDEDEEKEKATASEAELVERPQIEEIEITIKKEEEDGAAELKIKQEEEEELQKIDNNLNNLIDFSAWNLNELLKSGVKLLASEGDEYELNNNNGNGNIGDSNGNDNNENENSLIQKLKKQRLAISQEMKIEKVETELISQVKLETVEAINNEEDDQSSSGGTPIPPLTPISATTPLSGAPVGSAASSARLKAMQKRRAKVNAKTNANKTKPIDLSQSSISRKLVKDCDPNDEKNTNQELDASKFDITSQGGGDKLVVETKPSELSPLISQHAKVAGLVWQFQGVYELLLADLFDTRWEIRHGSALGLRELIKKHGKGAGRVMNKSKEENDKNNASTLSDLAIRLCTLFALDRFGDYVSDTVVIPVRESAAQTLAALLIHLNDETVLQAFDSLNQLVLQEDIFPKCWEASHGGMLGLRYFVSVRTDILTSEPKLLDKVVNMVLHGLKESDDDVQSVAALTLTPIVSEFVSKTKTEIVHTLLTVIWDCLTNLKDDLSASIGSVMDLLAKLCTHKEVIELMQQDAESPEDSLQSSFELLVPRLFPFLRHSITNVRKAVLRTLLEFLMIDNILTKKWIDYKSIRLLFQNLLVEQNRDVLKLSVTVYDKMIDEIMQNANDLPSIDSIFNHNNHSQALLTLLMTPIGIARHNYSMQTSLIMRPSGTMLGGQFDRNIDASADRSVSSSIEPEEPENGTNGNGNEKRGRKRKQPESQQPSGGDSLKMSGGIPIEDSNVNIDAPIFKGDVMLVGIDTFIRTRSAAATAYGLTLSYIKDKETLDKIFHLLLNYLRSPHSTPRLFSSMIIQEYAGFLRKRGEKVSEVATSTLSDILNVTLSTSSGLIYYRELVPILKGVRTSCLQLFNVFLEIAKVPPTKIPQIPVVVQGESEAGPNAFGLDNAEKILSETYPKLMKTLSPTYRMMANQALEDAKHRIRIAVDEAKSSIENRTTSILAVYAACILELEGVPKKLNPIIRSLMESIKQEESEILQLRSAQAVANLIKELNGASKKGAADKIVKNLCAFLCVDTSEVPEIHHNIRFKDSILSLRKEEAKTDPADIAAHERAVHQARIKRNGAMFALDSLLKLYGPETFIKVPKLKEIMLEPLDLLANDKEETYIADQLKGQSIIDSLGIVRALLRRLDTSLYDEITDRFTSLLPGLQSDYSIFRYSTAKCFATICSVVPTKAFTFLVQSILPMLNNAGEVKERQGAIECIYHLSTTMGSDILPYIVFLIVPVLGRMSDSDHDVRVLATTTFASIIKLVPLEAGIPDPPDMPQELLEGRDRERDFIQQMMDPTKVKPFDLPVTIKATLRKYQQDGVNWLAFLNKYHLHGILCDDMGLGKTLQTICIVSSDHHIRAEKYAETKSVEFRKVPTLIICPPSLTGHWEQEINQYAPFLKVLVYAGGPSIRSALRDQFEEHDIVVTSYDVCRNDVDFVSKYDYNYCVLDEGHIIKNAASKLTKAVKKIRAEHRLILSGTPIQNNVLELWSLFDFLMPGFLGTEKVFHDKFAKPIAASRTSKTSSKEQEAGALALESLHKQVLPFMMRRLKEDVLSDLPPKIIQDYYCELSDLQRQLYKDFANKQKSTVKEEVSSAGKGTADSAVTTTDDMATSKTHIFQALQYMRKLCNHPALVLSPQHPKFLEVTQYLASKKSDLKSIEHSPKLMSLKTLLLECGIGVSDSTYHKRKSDSASQSSMQQEQILSNEGGVISEHRALIFCQLKDMLDIVENQLLKKHLPSVTYMRLDGSTDPRDRQSIVRKFNEDPSIDVLLLTTKVGGLGLNLTGADTVIFVEHDWNPMNDLQAMDRAHRLGQKKVVNVYRLITKNTLEEKIMGLQKFKMNIASTIVNQQNAGLASMDTNQLLDLFDVDEQKSGAGPAEIENGGGEDSTSNGNLPTDVTTSGGLTGKAAGAVGELADLWDESQYEEEYNLDNFIKTLK